MMNNQKQVFAVCCDNGELYEDFNWWIHGIYSSKPAALAAAKDLVIDKVGELPEGFANIWAGDDVGVYSDSIGHVWIDARPLLGSD